MSFIVNFVKTLGIQPNPNMSYREARNILRIIKHALKDKMPPSKQHKIEHDNTLKEMIYTFQKQVERETDTAVYQSVVNLFQNPPNGLICQTQIGTKCENGLNTNGDFVWQTIPNRSSVVERFACDINICSPHFPQTLKKLQEFILKYQGGFKIPHLGHEGRSDTLNCYMTKPITPEIASEFYQIVKPCLNERFHDKLDGFPIFSNGQIIKGIKIGPEYATSSNTEKQKQIADKIYQQYQHSQQGLPQTFQGKYIFFSGSNNRADCSLGQKSAEAEVHQLIYYLAGLEGKSPFKLMNNDLTAPYEKHLDIGIFLNKNKDRYTPDEHITEPEIQASETAFTQDALHYWAFKAAPYFDVKNGILYLKEDLSAFDKFGIKQLKLKETLGISARPLKNAQDEIYAYAPTTLHNSKQWQQLLQAVQSNQRKGEPKEISREEAQHIAYIASRDFKAEGNRLMFRDLENKQTHTGLNAYGSYNSLIGLLREKYNIYYEPIHEKGTCTGFKIIGNKSRKALHHLFEALKNPEKYDTMRYTKHTTATSFGR